MIILKKRNELHDNPFAGGDVSRKMNKERVENRTHPFLGPEINQRRISNGTHHLLGKGMINVLDITTGLYPRITVEEYWIGKGVRYFNPNSKEAKEFKRNKNDHI